MERAQGTANQRIHVLGRLPQQSALWRSESHGLLVFPANLSRGEEFEPVFWSGGVFQCWSSGTNWERPGEYDQRPTGFRRFLSHAGIETCGGTRAGIK